MFHLEDFESTLISKLFLLYKLFIYLTIFKCIMTLVRKGMKQNVRKKFR